MKITSIIQLAAVMALSVLTFNNAVAPHGPEAGAGRDKFILPRPLVAFNGDDNGCVPDPFRKHRPDPIRLESRIHA